MSDPFGKGPLEIVGEQFSGIQAVQAEITGRVFESCVFTDCNFSQSLFSKCRFSECTFTKCNLSVIRVPHTKFIGTVFRECKLLGVDWTKAVWSTLTLDAPFQFHQCVLTDCSFWGLKLKGLVARDCRAHDVDFRDGSFVEADFRETDFENSLFAKTQLTRADFRDAINYQIDVLNNQITGAKFSRYEAMSLLDSLGIELSD